MRAALLAASLLLTACGPALLVPAAGVELPYESCGFTPTGIAVSRYKAACPDLARVNRIAGDVRDDHPRCSFEGLSLHVVGGYILGPNDEPVYAVHRPDRITVSSGGAFYGTVRHELYHHCGNDSHDPLR